MSRIKNVHENKAYKIRLQKGDTVVVRAGKYKGRTGKILATHPMDNTITVENINVIKRHMKPNRKYPQGGIIEMTKPMPVGKVGIYDPSTKRAAKISYKVQKDGTKVRIYKKSGKEIK